MIVNKVLHATNEHILKIVVETEVIIESAAHFVGLLVVVGLAFVRLSQLVNMLLGKLLVNGLKIGLVQVGPKSSGPPTTRR